MAILDKLKQSITAEPTSHNLKAAIVRGPEGPLPQNQKVMKQHHERHSTMMPLLTDSSHLTLVDLGGAGHQAARATEDRDIEKKG